MSDEEVRRAGVLKRVKAGELTQVEAAEMLALSYRQVKRLYGRFVEGGAKALVHRSAASRRTGRDRPRNGSRF
jgi:transposase